MDKNGKNGVAAKLAANMTGQAYDGYCASKDLYRPAHPTAEERFDRNPVGFIIGAVVLIVAVVMVGDYITSTIFPLLQVDGW